MHREYIREQGVAPPACRVSAKSKMKWYHFTCPICSCVIEGGGGDVDGNEDDRTHVIISEGDRRLCRWDDMPKDLNAKVAAHVMKGDENGYEHPFLVMLGPAMLSVIFEVGTFYRMKREGSLVIYVDGRTPKKSLKQSPVSSLYLLSWSYMCTKWLPPSINCKTPILRLKTHLIHWLGIRYRKLKSGRARPPKTELQALVESLLPDIEIFASGNNYRSGDCTVNFDEEDLACLGSSLSEIVETILENLGSNDAITILANNFNPDEFVTYITNIISTAVKKTLPCRSEETRETYEWLLDKFTSMVTYHLMCIAQCKHPSG